MKTPFSFYRRMDSIVEIIVMVIVAAFTATIILSLSVLLGVV